MADVPAEEKIALGKEFGYKNDHERDALAAAASAFKKYRNKFSQVEKKVPAEIDPDEVKALVVRGYSIENAIAEFVPSSLPKPGRRRRRKRAKPLWKHHPMSPPCAGKISSLPSRSGRCALTWMSCGPIWRKKMPP